MVECETRNLGKTGRAFGDTTSCFSRKRLLARRAQGTILALALLAVSALAGPPVSAVVYVIPTDESMVDRSPFIVFGEVVGAGPGSDDRMPTTDYLFAVDEVLKGALTGSTIVVRQPGGVSVRRHGDEDHGIADARGGR